MNLLKLKIKTDKIKNIVAKSKTEVFTLNSNNAPNGSNITGNIFNNVF